jgi:hypothetical protein
MWTAQGNVNSTPLSVLPCRQARQDILDEFEREYFRYLELYQGFLQNSEDPEAFRIFLPHFMRILDIQKDGYYIKFAAKDTAYYWAHDEDCRISPHARILKEQFRIDKRFSDPDVLLNLSTCVWYAERAMIYAQGSVFPTVPGRYPLPHNEGHFIITSDQHVIMYTSKNGSPYYHPNVQPCQEIWSG